MRMDPMIRIVMAMLLLAGPAFAACTNEQAREKSEAVRKALAAKMATKPDQASDLMGEWGDAMAQGVSEALCRKMDELAAKAARL